MADSHESKDHPPETYVKRTGREFNDLRAAFRKSWILGVCIVLALVAYGAYEMDLFKKKDDKKDASADIVKIAGQYIDLNVRYQKLQQEVQQKQDADKEEEIAKLEVKIDEQQREINAKAQSVGTVMVPDPTVYGGHRLIPASAIAAWTACVHTSKTVTAVAAFGMVTLSGSSGAGNKCDDLLKETGNQ